MKTIKGNLELTEDTVFDESITVQGDITCKDGSWFSLKVAGDINTVDINAGNIDAWNINARNIYARDIDALNINAVDINARDIDAWDINAKGKFEAAFVLCETLKVKLKAIYKHLITKRSSYEKKEHATPNPKGDKP